MFLKRLRFAAGAISITSAFVGCSSHDRTAAVPVDPALIQNSYDYTKPRDVHDKSKPVYMLPVINTGWAKAEVDPKTGQWVGGHYVGTVVDQGHWATLEEAELSGRPFMRADNGQMIVPNPEDANPGTGDNGMEIDLVGMRSRLEKLETAMADALPSSPSREAIATNMLQRKKEDIPTKSFPSIRVGEPETDAARPPTAGPMREKRSTILVGEGEPIKSAALPEGQGRHSGTVLEIPMGKAGQAMAVKAPQGDYVVLEFLPNRAVKAVYRGHTIRRLAPEGKDVIQLTLPQ
ncbi:hypothetical protein MAMC_01016 [Methylacidimicrobium cyclopophantes]|uniref:Uncharacterized protein n=1 Tax=Methylacidimicrobium cyclopophantes TaxID=1041766 RepID=A0A5E6MAN0_9BACT|nr:hypothetical protein [Methylacidimicrobium cyclopophantes]VVM06259.1 hypothetical protein MAMC_01016 [Methylacidimicrobium cyclopophantes]